jgi:hypothetical protein
VACPAPPYAWLPSLPALHLLGAWPAPCCFWSCLSNHIYCLWLLVLAWWYEFTPWCSAHEQGELCECWLWLLTVMCVICAGSVAVLVWLCWWCCYAGVAVLVVDVYARVCSCRHYWASKCRGL